MDIGMQNQIKKNKTSKNTRIRKFKNSLFHGLLLLSIGFGIVALFLLIFQVLRTGLEWINWDFITSMPSRFPQKAGIFSALVGSIWTIGLTALFSLPIGVGTAIYLEEYADKRTWHNKVLQLNISNLAGVPSIVYGILGLTVFVRFFNFERSILSGALTLTLLILPVIIVSAQEAIKSVPNSLREGSLALGVTKWQTVTGVVLPYALPGILTGSILAISRAMGEAAPLIMVGAAGYVAFLPRGPMDSFTVLPIQIFNWTSRPQAEFQNIASAGIIVLMFLLLSANAVAIILRNKYQNRMH
ncbi:phosphate ABC transporter permease PstA [Alkaliphilus oremlandii]|uniref:Phosphate transport system permease protein PstA n=1 Tax=Alkaliphilus oremlandii (strain OhILAs) TaxID=350688 RepID=A8MGX0_ALKOO|nr:phosphate ABC transporter permease PstA [Alkaliphilus oremlandii]ABW18664.1 phosphate ABC transporter, inner membrane subunit PstA [Alkaliphilus oremlandii OhILAs]